MTISCNKHWSRKKSSTVPLIEKSLYTNIALQAKLASRIAQISTLKAENRQNANRLLSCMREKWFKRDIQRSVTTTFTPEFRTKSHSHDYAKLAKKLDEKMKRSREDDLTTNNDALKVNKRRRRPYCRTEHYDVVRVQNSWLKKRWQYDEYRPWCRRYFVDPDGNIPNPNSDTVLRRELEGSRFQDSLPMDWSKSEEDNLQLIVEQVRTEMENKKACPDEKVNTTSQKLVHDRDVDYKEVSNRLVKFKGSDNSLQAQKMRSESDCRNKYLCSLSSAINISEWTKDESLQIVESVIRNDNYPNWALLATSLGTNRTPWQCFKHYQHSLNSKLTCRPWTPKEDELLVKYVASQGPTFLLNIHSAEEVARQFFWDRSPKQLYLRGHLSRANPNLSNEEWGEEEEKSLVMCMKMYSNANRSALACSGAHFPNRSSNALWDKWHRRLNPEISHKPWTAKEDAYLLKSVEDRIGSGGFENIVWSTIAKDHFMHRNEHSVISRWLKISSHDNLKKRLGHSFKAKGAARSGVCGSSGLFNSDDFVVRIKRQSKDLNLKYAENESESAEM